MPRCGLCGRSFRSCKAVESHWDNRHSEELQRRQSNAAKDGRGLILENLVSFWKRQVEGEVSV